MFFSIFVGFTICVQFAVLGHDSISLRVGVDHSKYSILLGEWVPSKIRKSLQQIENREYSTQKRINQNAYAFNVVFYGVIWRLDHNKGIRGEYFGGRWEKVNQKIDKYFGLQPARTWHGGGRKRGSEECGIAIVHFYVFTGVLELESRNYISNKIETCFMKLFYYKLGQNI